ncbi:MAG: sodium:proton antiporter [Pseudonocardia sp.]|nr:sodium:proton antiporter [Pseudonocardia sp.]
MSRRSRLAVFLVGAAGVAALYLLAVLHAPAFGTTTHPMRDAAVRAALAHATANVVSTVNYDARALDTLGEETLLLASVVGAAALLRPTARERETRGAHEPVHVLEPVQLAGYLMLPITLLIGADVVLHGQLTPGGGFQGGVVLGTGIHLVYLTGRYRALENVRPLRVFVAGEAVGTAVFAATGLAALAGAGFLANVLPTGTFGTMLSGGTVPLLNAAVGVEVASGVIVLLAGFLDQLHRTEAAA